MTPTTENSAQLIERVKQFHSQLELLVAGLTKEQLTTPYVEGEWTATQIVHHLADAHTIKRIQIRSIIVEEQPVLTEQDDEALAKLVNGRSASVESSLSILKGQHELLAILLESLKDTDWQRRGLHPKHGEVTLTRLVERLIAHGIEHLDQIRIVLKAQYSPKGG